MVATRNSHKRQRLEPPPQDSVVAASNGAPPPPRGSSEEPAEPMLLLSSEEQAGPSPFDTFPKELLPNIFKFLVSVDDVFNLAMCSNKLHEAVTPTIVIRAAVLGASRTHRQGTACMHHEDLCCLLFLIP
jgi:hypothetical protein